MMGQLVRFPAAEGIYDRLTEQQRLANIKAERAEAVHIARAVLRAPERYTEDNLRDACVALRRWGDGFDHLTADAMVYAINRREQIARDHNWPAILAYGAVGAAILLAFTGWL